MADWIEDLAEFPAEFVDEACRRWRQGADHRKRPLPGDLRFLCIAIQRERAPFVPKTLVTDQRDEPIPPEDVVREGWRKIPFPRLTKAERSLFREATGLADPSEVTT